MQVADEQSYEEVIARLKTYVSEVGNSTGAMYCAGTDCVDNTMSDPAAVASNEKLVTALDRIVAAVRDINQIIIELNQELEEIREAAAAAQSGE